jgi:hypothetical protein
LTDSKIDHTAYARDIVVGSKPPHCNREEFVSFYITGIQQEDAPKEKRLMVSERGKFNAPALSDIQGTVLLSPRPPK